MEKKIKELQNKILKSFNCLKNSEYTEKDIKSLLKNCKMNIAIKKVFNEIGEYNDNISYQEQSFKHLKNNNKGEKKILTRKLI